MRHSELILAGVLAIFAAALTVGVVVWYSDVGTEPDKEQDEGHMTEADFQEISEIDGMKYTWVSATRTLTVEVVGSDTVCNALAGGTLSINEEEELDLSDILVFVAQPGVTNIGAGSFHDCGQLQTVTLPDSVTEIETEAFEGCSHLQNFNTVSGKDYLPSNLVTIGRRAFASTPVAFTFFPGTVTSIGDYAFNGCFNLGGESTLYLPGSILKLGSGSTPAVTIGEYAFNGCSKIHAVVVPLDILSIGEYAFHNCTNLSRVFVDRYSSLTIEAGQTTNGEVARYASDVITVIKCQTVPKYSQGYGPGGEVLNTPDLNPNSTAGDIAYLTAQDKANLANSTNPSFTTTCGQLIYAHAIPGYNKIFSYWDLSGADYFVKAYFIEDGKTITIQASPHGSASPSTVTVPLAYTVTDSMDNPVSINGTSVTATPETGYKFTSWTASGDTLTAGFTPISYTISFRGGEGATGTTASIPATYDQEYPLPSSGFTKDHYTFIGWRQSL